MNVNPYIFREYDIRGVVPSQINEASIGSISYAIAKKCKDENITEVSAGKNSTNGKASKGKKRKQPDNDHDDVNVEEIQTK